ncbi:hypothetical protein LP420_38165 [Massilia sp. B-10]|nr:hypothetical protein LP420_38165 [Massilia sp. B-10]
MRLPLMMIAEVGPSSMGQIQLLRDSLPGHRKNEAVYLRLQNSTQFAVNLFDTQLGARHPTDREADFLVDFLNALCGSGTRVRASRLRASTPCCSRSLMKTGLKQNPVDVRAVRRARCRPRSCRIGLVRCP